MPHHFNSTNRHLYRLYRCVASILTSLVELIVFASGSQTIADEREGQSHFDGARVYCSKHSAATATEFA